MRNNNFSKIMAGAVLLFLLYNTIPLVINLAAYMNDRPHPKAKLRLAIAKTINEIYVVPVSYLSIVGLNLSDPFIDLRDHFFSEGISLIPEHDVEREIWWTTIHFHEYCMIYRIKLALAYKVKNISPQDKDQLYIWTDELRKKLTQLSKKTSFQDPNVPSLRIERANKLALAYVYDREILVNNFPIKQYGKLRSNKPFFEDFEEIKKVIEVDDAYNTLRNRAFLSKDKQGMSYLKTDYGKYRDLDLRHVIYADYLMHEYLKTNRIICENNIAYGYIDTYSALKRMAEHPEHLPRLERDDVKKSLNTKVEKIILQAVKDSCGLVPG